MRKPLRALGRDLNQVVNAMGLAPGLRRYQIQAAWELVVGAVMAGQSRPTVLKGEILFVRTSGPLWSQEVMLRKTHILDKLNEIMPDKGITQIRCRIGLIEAQAGPPPAPKGGEWNTIELGPQSLERVARVTEKVNDPALRQSLRRVLEQVEKRRAWAYRQGQRPCCLCGQFQDHSICRGCEMEQQRRRTQKLFQALGRAPWLTCRDLQREFPGLRPPEFLEARQKLRSVFERNYRNGREGLTPGQPFPTGLRQIMVDLTMISTGVELEHLAERHVLFTFGKTWGKAYLADSAPDMVKLREEWKKKGISFTSDGRLHRAGRPKRAAKPASPSEEETEAND